LQGSFALELFSAKPLSKLSAKYHHRAAAIVSHPMIIVAIIPAKNKRKRIVGYEVRTAVRGERMDRDLNVQNWESQQGLK
jgi:hypothetical protein